MIQRVTRTTDRMLYLDYNVVGENSTQLEQTAWGAVCNIPTVTGKWTSQPPLADPRGEGRGGPWPSLATWASAQNALKVAIFRLKIEKKNMGRGNAPSPDPS